MPLVWVLFSLTGTLVDPSVLAHALGDSARDEDLVLDALDDAIAQAMVRTLTGGTTPLNVMVGSALRRRLRLAGRDERAAEAALELMGTMPAYLEAPAALETLRGHGLRVGVLTQSSADSAASVLRFAGLRDRVELVVGAQDTGAFKPSARPYHVAVERTGAAPEEVCMVSTHWWDVVGAKSAGLRTGWVARRELTLLDTVPEPDFTGRDLAEVARAIAAARLAA
jgi:2-haloacid dehalogenase